jgi:tetratricopeptide (TPR) repeat protein
VKSVLLTIVSSALVSSATIAAPTASAPLLKGMGTHHHPITGAAPRVQKYFDQGLTLLYAFNHKEAVRSFEAAAALDPDCAMAWWGVAYAYGPHVNKPMDASDTTNAWTALNHALRLKSKASPREQAYIDALAKRYQPEYVQDRSAFDKAFVEAMREVAHAYPDDLDAQVFFVESIMNTMPWNYWTHDRTPKPETEEALERLRYVMRRNPNHPGANHFYIHTVEAGPAPDSGLPAAYRLADAAPGAGHLVHMPAHIYIRVGMYDEAVKANELAVQADRTYIRECRAQGFYPSAYYPHNLHFLWFARLMNGESRNAYKVAEEVAQNAYDSRCGPSPAVEAPRFRHLPWLTKARFGQWDEVLKVPQPPSTNDFLMDRAFWHFTRGLAFAARKDAAAAAREHQALAELAHSDQAKSLDQPTLPVTAILQVADHWLAAKVAGARGENQLMVEQFERAVATEDKIPYMEPPYWPIPTRPALGAALLASGDFEKAEHVFREDLNNLPRNAWGLAGLAESLRRQGKAQAADAVQRECEAALDDADVKLDLAWF